LIRRSSSHKKLSDNQYLLIEEMNIMEIDILNRIAECKRSEEYASWREFDEAECRFIEAFMWFRRGVENE
jgi:hypothetical protein